MAKSSLSRAVELVDGIARDSVAVSDRGLAYGDGLFETIALAGGKALAWQRHVDRLSAGAERLGIAMPAPELLEADLEKISQSHRDGVIKIVLTRGSGGRGYQPHEQATSRRMTTYHPWPAGLNDIGRANLTAVICRHRLGLQPATAGLKHLNRLDQVLASREWSQPEYFEGLMLDLNGCLIEGTRSNVFLVINQTLITPKLDTSGVRGIVHDAICELAAGCGLRLEQRTVMPSELTDADEVFLTNSIIGVRSLSQISGAGWEQVGKPAVAEMLAARLRRERVIV